MYVMRVQVPFLAPMCGRLQLPLTHASYADVAELVDALDSGSSESNFMWVQVPSSAPVESLYA